MFDIGWSEFAVIAVVALIAIGPKELPGVLRMVGQWVAKARKMAGEFQGQFQEAMREAEMADLKKSFDEVREAASGLAGGNVLTSLTSLQNDVSSALGVDDKPAAVDGKPAAVEETPAIVEDKPPAGVYGIPTAEEAVRLPPITPVPEPVAVVTPENRSQSETASVAVEAEGPRDAKAS
jgi:sec-independent protein translocase protein TatB